MPPEWRHLGMFGPVVRATVGDSILFHFKNLTTRPLSVHPHGVFYDKASEGAPYADGSRANQQNDDAVPPGASYTYRWGVPERAGPGPSDPSSVTWMYHSHTDEVGDNYAGLIGHMIITGKGKAKADGSPVDVDREDVTELLPATMLTADMQPDNPGKWLYHCHVNDHILAGMLATYRVNP